jgi:hypothetical protein
MNIRDKEKKRTQPVKTTRRYKKKARAEGNGSRIALFS